MDRQGSKEQVDASQVFSEVPTNCVLEHHVHRRPILPFDLGGDFQGSEGGGDVEQVEGDHGGEPARSEETQLEAQFV